MNIYIYVIAIIVICLMSFIFNHYHTEHMQNIYSLSRVGNGVGDTRGNKPMYDWGNIVPDNINFYDQENGIMQEMPLEESYEQKK